MSDALFESQATPSVAGLAANQYLVYPKSDGLWYFIGSDAIEHQMGYLVARSIASADATSITPNCNTTDVATQVNTQVAGTLVINAPSGAPVNGQRLNFRIKCTNGQNITWSGIYRGSTDLTLPAITTGSGKTDYLLFIYNSTDSTWDLLGKNFGF